MFEWDEAKNRANLRKHRISFESIVTCFSGPMLVSVDDREDYGETRYFAVGFLQDVPVVIVYAERGETIRIISARKADRRERQKLKDFLSQIDR